MADAIKIAVAAHPQIPGALSEADAIADYLKSLGFQTICTSLNDPDLRRQTQNGEVDVFIAIGGDGTMLRAGHLCAPKNIPILGINMGRFGFLMEFNHESWREMFSRFLKNDYWIEKRMMLRCEHWRNEDLQGYWDVLNEAVVSRGQIGRPVQIHTHVDQRFLTTYVADGLIVATPTGSTAYALAAGGPILPPELRNILLVPIAPHLSFDRSIVLAEGACVSISVHTQHQAVLCYDGQEPVALQDRDVINVHSSDFTVQFIRFRDPGYFYRNLTPHMNQNPSIGVQR